MTTEVTIIAWQPLPAPANRYVLARYIEDGKKHSIEAATDQEGNLLYPGGNPISDIENFDAWAYLPYDSV